MVVQVTHDASVNYMFNFFATERLAYNWMGRYNYLFLSIVEKLALGQPDGKLPVLILWLKILVKTGAISEAHFCSTNWWMPSELRGFVWKIASSGD